jgi:hypothetical protein
MSKLPLIIAYGGGLNSTAMLCGFKERGIKPDLILFADTGGEMPETYQHVRHIDGICKLWWGIGVEVVNYTMKDGRQPTLEDLCLNAKMLPSLAYGRKACSMKHKIQPQSKRMIEWCLENGFKECLKAIGYDAKESHRRIDKTHEIHARGFIERFTYPLIEWQWGREECAEAIKRHNLPVPGKSACFFCPAMKRGEILRLKNKHPELFDRAVAIEEAANGEGGKNRTPRGLTGRSFMWSDIVKADQDQGKLWEWLDENDENPIPCGCFDGGITAKGGEELL